MCCNTLGSQFCLGTSLFCLVYMLFVGYLITIDYDYLGEWKATALIPATSDEKDTASRNCFIVAGIYGAFSVMSIIAIGYYKIRGK